MTCLLYTQVELIYFNNQSTSIREACSRGTIYYTQHNYITILSCIYDDMLYQSTQLTYYRLL